MPFAQLIASKLFPAVILSGLIAIVGTAGIPLFVHEYYWDDLGMLIAVPQVIAVALLCVWVLTRRRVKAALGGAIQLTLIFAVVLAAHLGLIVVPLLAREAWAWLSHTVHN